MRPILRSLPLLLAGAAGASAQPGPREAYRPPPFVLAAPIERWDEAMPLGNGWMGGLLWGEADTIRVSLDRGDLWDERLPEVFLRPEWNYATIRRLVAARDQQKMVELFDEPYESFLYPTKLPAGRLEIALAPGREARAFRLDPYRAAGAVELDAGRLEAFYSAAEPVALIRTSEPVSAFRVVPPGAVEKLGYPPARVGRDARAAWFEQEAAEGFRYAVAVGEARDAGGSLLAVAITSSHDSADPLALARSRVATALGRGFEALRAPHEAWWRDFWAVSHVRLPDPTVQWHYDLVKYFYGAASRPDAPPIPLQGVWTADEGGLPPWKGDYHNDLNTQMTYLPYHAAGLVDQGMSFLNLNSALLPQYRAFARRFYDVPGALVPGVMTLGGKPMSGWAQYSFAPTNAAWVAHSFYLHWRYTMDERFLRERAYPFTAAIGEAHRALLAPDAAGRLKLPLSSSPEIFNNSMEAWLPPNSNYDLALMRWLFGALEEMATALDRAEEAAGWRRTLDGLEPYHLDEQGGFAFAEGIPYRESHRHFSHAMAIHPLGLVTVEGGDRDRRTIDATVQGLVDEGTDWWVGYSYSWMASLLARTGRAEQALDYLKTYARAFVLRNGFHVNGDQTSSGLSNFTYRPFTLEGNFLVMDAVHEMLIQSWGGRVRVFPAVSEGWKDVSFEALRAEGGFRVSARREDGLTREVRVVAGVEQTLRLADPFDGAPARWNRADVRREDGGYVVRLRPGERLVGTPAR